MKRKKTRRSVSFGLFETMRALNNRIVYLDRHLLRLRNSCRTLRIKLHQSTGELRKFLLKIVRKGKLRDARVKLALWEAQGKAVILISLKKYKPFPAKKYKKGFSATVSPYRQRDYVLSRIKTTDRALYELGYNCARKKRFDEAIILNSGGYIAEATRSNIFIVKGNRLFTPFLECGCLDGITRRAVFDLARKAKINACEKKLTLFDLYSADEAFLTNSLMGIMPLAAIDKNKIGEGRCGRITGLLIKKYNCLLK